MNRIGIPLVALLAVSLAARAVARNDAVRERLMEAAGTSERLRKEACPLPDDLKNLYSMEAVVPQDRRPKPEARFATVEVIEAYRKNRPWEAAYGEGRRAEIAQLKGALTGGTVWPTLDDAGFLRELLTDPDGVLRSLAVEALATLHQPEDVPRLAGLLNDNAPGVPVLGWSHQMNAVTLLHRRDRDPTPADPVPWRTWHDRTVATYAREGLRQLTGHRFDGFDAERMSFEEWWKTHDLGLDSVWFWQRRFEREQDAVRGRALLSEADRTVADEAASNRRKETLRLLDERPPGIRAKVFLATGESYWSNPLDEPVNRYLPGFRLPVTAEEALRLLEDDESWKDLAGGPPLRPLAVGRLARLVAEGTISTENVASLRPRLRTAIERDANDRDWMPLLVSRLLPSAADGDLDNPETREGYLKTQLMSARSGIPRAVIAAEMVRANLDGLWPTLEPLFADEELPRGEISGVRTGVLTALGESPATPRKLEILATLIEDPRNAERFTQPNREMGMDTYRRTAVQSVNAIAGREAVSFEILQNLGDPRRSEAALAELRTIVRELKDARR